MAVTFIHEKDQGHRSLVSKVLMKIDGASLMWSIVDTMHHLTTAADT